MDSGGGFLGCWEAGRLVRHESRRRSMARVAGHLSVEDLEAGFRSAQDPTATRHFQVIWLLARGHTIADVAAVTSFVATPPSDGGLWTGPKVAAWMAGELGLATVLPQ